MAPTPGPVLRVVFRAPLVFFRLGLGWIFAGRILMVVHIGRSSGLVRETCLEVIGKAGDERFVISAFGQAADWLANIEAGGAVEVRVGSTRFAASHRVLDPIEAAGVLGAYESKHPRLFATFGRWFEWHHDGTPSSLQHIAAGHPVVGFAPR